MDWDCVFKILKDFDLELTLQKTLQAEVCISLAHSSVFQSTQVTTLKIWNNWNLSFIPSQLKLKKVSGGPLEDQADPLHSRAKQEKQPLLWKQEPLLWKRWSLLWKDEKLPFLWSFVYSVRTFWSPWLSESHDVQTVCLDELKYVTGTCCKWLTRIGIAATYS